MALFAKLISTLFGFFLAIFSRFVIAEKAARMAVIASYLLMLAALFASLATCLNGVCGNAIAGISMSHPNFAVGLGLAFNNTTLTAASCYMSVWLACQLYIAKKKVMTFLAG